MIRSLITRIVRRRNPNFTLDPQLNTGAILSFVWKQCWALMRGLLVIFYGKNPKFMLRGRGVQFFNLSKISWGKFLKLGDQVSISALSSEGVTLGNNVSIGSFSQVIVSTSFNNVGKYIRIGDNVGIGEFAYLGGASGLSIGDSCIIGQYFSCHG